VHRQRFRAPGRGQKGVTLIVGLIMLVLVTLLVLSTFHLGRTNLEIVGNVQHRNEALGAAQQTIEAAISSPLLTTNPSSIFPNPCKGENTLCFDVNGDGTDDLMVTLTPTPTCVKAEVIKTANLNLAVEDDRRCTIQVAQTLGIENTGSSDSLCSNSLWDIRAEAQDTATRTTAVIEQGVAVRVRTVDVSTSCP
jgi:Tfp pilus assembly protein PilX